MENRFELFTSLISCINKNIRKVKNLAMKEFSLNSTHVSCLYYLYKNEALTSKEIVELCEEDKAAISRTLEYLEINEYIICDSKAKKRYNNKLYLTDKGKTVGKYISTKVEEILNLASNGIDEKEREILYKCLNVINNNHNTINNKGEKNEY